MRELLLLYTARSFYSFTQARSHTLLTTSTKPLIFPNGIDAATDRTPRIHTVGVTKQRRDLSVWDYNLLSNTLWHAHPVPHTKITTLGKVLLPSLGYFYISSNYPNYCLSERFCIANTNLTHFFRCPNKVLQKNDNTMNGEEQNYLTLPS